MFQCSLASKLPRGRHEIPFTVRVLFSHLSEPDNYLTATKPKVSAMVKNGSKCGLYLDNTHQLNTTTPHTYEGRPQGLRFQSIKVSMVNAFETESGFSKHSMA